MLVFAFVGNVPNLRPPLRIMKLFILLVFNCALITGLWAADEKTQFVSPNGKYAIRMEDDDGMKTFIMIDVKTGEVLVKVDSLGNPYSNDFKFLWASDSQRAASYSPDRRGGSANLFVREGATFRQIELPDMPKLNWKGREEAKTVTSARIPVRWIKANVLLIDHEVEDDDGVSAKGRAALTFNEKNDIKVTKAKP